MCIPDIALSLVGKFGWITSVHPSHYNMWFLVKVREGMSVLRPLDNYDQHHSMLWGWSCYRGSCSEKTYGERHQNLILKIASSI